MPPAIHTRAEVIQRLMRVIRRVGYDGASISALSEATGLGKSSLYHHFPQGKHDMVRAVLEHLAEFLHAQLFEPLRAAGTPKRRVEAMISTLDAFYAEGHESCVLAQLVLGSARAGFRAPLRTIFTDWIDALTAPLVDAGIARATARRRAEDAVVRIEGALVLAGGLGDVGVFARTLKQLPGTLFA